FPVFDGQVSRLPDGRQQVRLSLSAADVEILDSTRRTQMTRGAGFFDARRYPWITFLSDPFDPELLARGGPLPGLLNLRDVRRPPARGRPVTARCARPVSSTARCTASTAGRWWSRARCGSSCASWWRTRQSEAAAAHAGAGRRAGHGRLRQPVAGTGRGRGAR